MRKTIAMVLCAALLLSVALPALAETSFEFSTTATSGMLAWTTTAAQSNGKNWHFTWDSTTNISPSCRAVVRIMTSEGNSASSLWVYSSLSTSYHAYTDSAAYGKKDTYPAGRLDNRDGGQELYVKGTFWN